MKLKRFVHKLNRPHFTKVCWLFVFCLLQNSSYAESQDAEFFTDFNLDADRHFIGEEFWSNPMEAWKLKNGRVEAVYSPKKFTGLNLYLLTYSIEEGKGGFSASADFGMLKGADFVQDAGFKFGLTGGVEGYRSAVLQPHKGIVAGINTNGQLFIGDQSSTEVLKEKSLTMKLKVRDEGDVMITAFSGDKKLASFSRKVKPAQIVGGLALITNHEKPGKLHWFDNWRISGPQLKHHPERSFGPIFWSQYTLSRQVMKMIVQMPPMGEKDSDTVAIEFKRNDQWEKATEAKIHPQSRTALLRIENWDDKKDHDYRLVYLNRTTSGMKPCYWEGTIRKDPVDWALQVAAFTGNQERLFPNNRIVSNLLKQNPDMLFFSGDQLYEYSMFGVVRDDNDLSHVSYLRRWYMFGWAFREVLKDRPSVIIPDDHDVFQPNIWGNSGNRISYHDHPKGGYMMHEDFINTVHRTQTGHHPDAYDPRPIKRGISVYYGDMVYGRVSFAILADRMFKTGPAHVATWEGRPDYTEDRNIDVAKLDHPDAILLGERQLDFLEAWGRDWKGADMKCVLSQTIFANLANYIGPKELNVLVDLDSNGWPQTGRNKALRSIRKGHAFMLAGDQHLASIVHHGVDAQGDSGFSFCVPSICIAYPRAWRPDREGRPAVNRIDDLPNTGDYTDGFDNKVRVYGVANPADHPKRVHGAYQESSLERSEDTKTAGHGVVVFDKAKREITMSCYRLLFDADKPSAEDQFPAWPRTIKSEQNYGRAAVAYLPQIIVEGSENPVFELMDAESNHLYSIRPRAHDF